MKLQELHSYIQEHQPNICQISVLQSGNELYSAEWNGYQRTDCVHIASATKSVMALLIGIAIDRQRIGSVDNKVLAYFPEYSVKRGEKTIFDVTIRQLLTMRALQRAWRSMDKGMHRQELDGSILKFSRRKRRRYRRI